MINELINEPLQTGASVSELREFPEDVLWQGQRSHCCLTQDLTNNPEGLCLEQHTYYLKSGWHCIYINSHLIIGINYILIQYIWIIFIYTFYKHTLLSKQPWLLNGGLYCAVRWYYIPNTIKEHFLKNTGWHTQKKKIIIKEIKEREGEAALSGAFVRVVADGIAVDGSTAEKWQLTLNHGKWHSRCL